MCEARLKPPGDGCRKPSCSSSKKLTTLSNQASRSGGWAPSVARNWSCRSVGRVVGWVSQEVVAIVIGRSGSVSDRDGDNDGSVLAGPQALRQLRVRVDESTPGASKWHGSLGPDGENVGQVGDASWTGKRGVGTLGELGSN